MAHMSGLVIVFAIVTLASSLLVSAEIHRAKSPPSKLSSSHRNRVLEDHDSRSERGRSADDFDKLRERSSESLSARLSEGMFAGHSHETWVCSLLSAGLVGLSGIFPLLVIPLEAGQALRQGRAAAHLNLLLSFAVGGLLGDVFLHLLPEAWAHLDKEGHDHEGHLKIGLWVLVGIFSFLILEKCFGSQEDLTHHSEDSETTSACTDTTTADEHEECTNSKENLNGYITKDCVIKHRNTKDSNSSDAQQIKNLDRRKSPENEQKNIDIVEHIKISGYLNLLANVIDNFTHGLAVGGSYVISRKVGLLTTFAILLHEIPHEVGDFAILLRSGFDRWKAAKAQLLTASGGMVGAVTCLLSESAEVAGNRVAWILPFTSGGFIYIALVTVVPDLLQEKNPWESFKQVVCMVLGIGVMMGVTLYFD